MRDGAARSAAFLKEGSPSCTEERKPPAPEDARAAGELELDSLYRAHASRLVRFFARHTGSRDDAGDLVQEAFTRLLRLGRTGPAFLDRPEAYLNRVTRNLLHDRRKVDRRRSTHLHVVADNEPLAGPDQQRLLETRDMLRRLEAAMLQLKPKTRDIFMAHRLDGMSYAEIADRTGLSIKGVEKQMSKAIAHIDRLLDRQ